jgi:hypothetical protein
MPGTSRRARFGRSTAVFAPGLGPGLVLALALTGCDHLTALLEEKAQEVAEEIAPPEGAAPPAGPVLSDDEQLAAKLALYTECRGRASRRMRQSWQRYTEHVKEDDGTPRRDKDGKAHKPFLHEIHGELTPCEEAVAKGPAMAPSLPEIEATMATWLDHAKAFAAATVELDAYYEKETYATDDWAKGKQLAPGFLAAWQGWSKADDELAALVEVRLDVVERALLTQLEARLGKDLEWHARTVVLRAKELARCVGGPPATEATGSGDTAEPAEPAARPGSRGKAELACDAPLEAVRTAAADFRSSYDADRTRADAVFWMSAFEASVTDFVAEAERVVGKPPKGGPTPEQIAKLLDERDDLVSDAANLRFDR